MWLLILSCSHRFFPSNLYIAADQYMILILFLCCYCCFSCLQARALVDNIFIGRGLWGVGGDVRDDIGVLAILVFVVDVVDCRWHDIWVLLGIRIHHVSCSPASWTSSSGLRLGPDLQNGQPICQTCSEAPPELTRTKTRNGCHFRYYLVGERDWIDNWWKRG